MTRPGRKRYGCPIRIRVERTGVALSLRKGVTGIAFDLASFSAIMVLMVTGLGMIASMMGIFNFAHGEFLLLGAYTVYLTHAHRLSGMGRHAAAPLRGGARRPRCSSAA